MTEAKVGRARQLRRDMTPEERALWKVLRTNRFAGLHFRRQQVIDGFIVDFYCHRALLVVEVDGGVHEGRAEYDRERDAILSARDIAVLRATNDEVRRNLTGVLGRIWLAARQRMTPSDSPSIPEAPQTVSLVTECQRMTPADSPSICLPLPSQGRGPGG